MSLPASGVALPAFDNTLGALLLGAVGAIALWGVTCVQAFTYFNRGSRDLVLFKAFVGFLWVLDTFDSFLDVHILYHYLIVNFANPLAVLSPAWSVILHVAITSISNFIIRTMFARRVYLLSSRNILLTLWIMAVSLTELVCGIVITVKAFNIQSYLGLKNISTILYLDFATNFTSDASVALSLCYYLYRSRTGFTRTDSLITILMLYTINSGLLVAVDASIGMITYIVMPTNLIFLGFYLLLSKLYLNSYLASLNAREGLRGFKDPVSIHLSNITGSTTIPRFTTENFALGSAEKGSIDPLGVSVETTVHKSYGTDQV